MNAATAAPPGGLRQLRIDFVSDIACPWCAVGAAALQGALDELAGTLQATLHCQPFELNPDMPPEGEDATEHISRKYGIDAAQVASNRQHLHARGAEEGFAFGSRARVWNTFAAHRLLHWAGAEAAAGQQWALKRELLRAYHGEGLNPGEHAVLLGAVRRLGLDERRAAAVLESDAFAGAVRASERRWQQLGIHAVPAVVVDDRHLIQGGQPRAVFVQALRQIAATPV